MALDTTATLIAEAQAKLAELDSRVASYRHEMATEFTRYSEELLRDVPEDVAYQVSQAIADSISTSYPALYPPGSTAPSPSNPLTGLSETSWNGNRSPPPILPHTSGTPKGQPPSPHARELEFQGLFTPTYLPLLESIDRDRDQNLHSPTTSPGPAPTNATATATATTSATAANLTSGHTTTSEGTQTPESTHRRRRPSPLRSATDTSLASAVSDTSSVRVRKSALRRSSGSSRSADSPRDPRRVRFEFEGEEFLPSTSPQSTTTALAEWGSASSGSGGSSTPTDDYFPVRSLADIEGEEAPRPRKVSSSQALRALSKAPLDDGTTWTVVNPDAASQAASAPDADKVGVRTHDTLPAQEEMEPREVSSREIPERPNENATGRKGEDQAEEDRVPVRTAREESESDDDSSDDEGSLFMLSKKSPKNGPRASPAWNQVLPTSASGKPSSVQSPSPKATPSEPAIAEASTGPNASEPTPSAPVMASTSAPPATLPSPSGLAEESAAEDDEEPDLFNLDADEDDLDLQKAISAHKSPKKHFSELPDEPGPEQKQEADDSEANFKGNAPISASPPITIPIRSPSEIPPKVVPMPQGSTPRVSIGSYNGRSLIMSPVKDPELLERIKRSDDAAPPFFVGSLHGRSGPDASNVKSYVASLPSPKGMPGSFFERYMREKEGGTKYGSDREGSEGKA
ncbi:hypothetical protein VPNG_03325 [Cytospora leucostoma]|uniref:Uncharacterized protein n=1 Tax=Cytospora leucostoma TaxID=1230097 RepID=A0A423XFZ3_9PEZI|nr:hypothetical protein VPNG_03325 [Cytospora leucostoma]